MTELLWKKTNKLLETFTSMETNISLLHTEINNVKEKIKTNTEKTNDNLKIRTELINEKN